MSAVINPAASSGGGSVVQVNTFQSKLSATSSPYSNGDQIGAATLFAAWYQGNQDTLVYGGTTNSILVGATQPSLSLSGLTSGKLYDVFMYDAGPSGPPAIKGYTIGGTTGPSCTATYPSGISVGETLLLVVSATNSGTITTPTGWTSYATGTNASQKMYVYYKVALGTETGSLSFSATGLCDVMYIMYDISGASIPEAQTSATYTTTTTQNAPSVTTLGASHLAIFTWAAYDMTSGNGQGLINIPGTLTATTNLNDPSPTLTGGLIRGGYELVSSAGATGTQAATISTISGSPVWDGIVFSVSIPGPVKSGKQLVLGPAWTTTTSRSAALTYINGIPTLSTDSTRRYIGTICATGTGTTEDSKANRYIYDHNNPEWLPTTGTTRVQYNGLM